MNDSSKFHDILREARKYDIVFLQETKLCQSKIGMLRAKWRWHEGVYMSSGGARRGVITLFSEKIRVEHLEHVADVDGQFLLNVVVIEGKNFLIVNVYGDPDLDRNSEMTMIRLADVIEEKQRVYVIHEIIMGGDFNFVLYQEDTKSTSRKPRAEAQFASMVEDLDVFDLDLLVNDKTIHTYFRHRREGCSARYDRFYVSRGLIIDARFARCPRTGDHTPIYIDVMVKPRGQGIWKFDDRLLLSVAGVAKIQSIIAEVLREFVDDTEGEISVNMLQEFVDFHEHCPIDLLSLILTKVTEGMKEVMKNSKEEVRLAENEALMKLIQARREMNELGTEESVANFEDAREALRMRQWARASAADEANYIQYATAGEKMTGYFFRMMGKGKASRDIRRLSHNGQVLEGEDVAKHLSDKFASLAMADPNVGGISIEQYLGELTQGVRKVPDNMKERLSRPITLKEVEDVVRGLKDISVPGPSGITNKLLKAMLPSIKNILVHAGNKLLFGNETEIPGL